MSRLMLDLVSVLADIERRDYKGRTPLQLAAELGMMPVDMYVHGIVRL